MVAPKKNEPNKYAKNADIEADSLVKTISSVAGLILVLVGLIGIEFFQDGGWLKTALSWLM